MKKYIDPEKLPQLFREGTDENGDALVALSEVRKALSLATVDAPVMQWKNITDAKRIEALILKSEILCDSCGEVTLCDCAKYLGKYLAENGATVRDTRRQSPTVYICSPYRGKTRRNIEYAQTIVKSVLAREWAPICPHLYLPQVLDDSKPEERERALRVGLELLRQCDFVVVGNLYGISEGMKAEIDEARRLGLLIYYTNKI